MRFELNPKNLSNHKKKKAKILIAQTFWEPSQIKRDVNQLFQLEFTKENSEFLHLVLEKGNDRKVDLIVFPEFAIPEKYHENIKTWTSSKKVIVVAGSTYLKREGKFYNTASVFFEGIQYKTEKHNLSPHEVSRIIGCGPSPGKDQHYFHNTPVGNLAVMICADAFHKNTRDALLNVDLDILCVIAVQSKGKEHHQSIDRIVKEYKNGIYVVYCNALCNSVSDGRSAFFGNDYKEGFSEFKEAGLTRDDGIDRRVIEMPQVAGCLIVECNLENKKVAYPNHDSSRSLIKAEMPFVFEKGNLRQLTAHELIPRVKRTFKNEAEYQSSITPVKTFVASHIGRQADIDYLNDFLNDSKKHFLLLYGVGGMGKSHLLYCCMKDYKGKTFCYHIVKNRIILLKVFKIIIHT
jgi:predicted amidohydrolase